MMTARRLEALRDAAMGETPMTKVALEDLANPETVRTQLQVELEKHVRARESFGGLIDRIQRVTSSSTDRAARIAQTEKTRSANGTRYGKAIDEYLTAYDKAKRQHRKRPDPPRFQWINPRTAKEPRHNHVAISGAVREVGEPFLPGLRYPGDPAAPAGETINCHCYIRRVR
jgi:hypothetical protein